MGLPSENQGTGVCVRNVVARFLFRDVGLFYMGYRSVLLGMEVGRSLLHGM